MGTVVTMATFRMYGTSAMVAGLYVEKHVKPICCLIYNVSELWTVGWEIFLVISILAIELGLESEINTLRPEKRLIFCKPI